MEERSRRGVGEERGAEKKEEEEEKEMGREKG